MLKLQRWSFWATVVALAALLVIDGAESRGGPRRQQQDPAQQTQIVPTTPEQRGTEQAPFIIRTIPGPTDEAKTAEDAKERREKAEFDRKLVVFNGDVAFYTKVLAAAAILQFGALLLQAYWMSKTVKISKIQAGISKKQAEFTEILERAYISARPAGINPFISKNGRIDEEIVGHIDLVNSGHIPARDIGLDQACITWSDKILTEEELTFKEPEPMKTVLTPGAIMTLGTQPYSNENIGGDGYFYVFGKVTYIDAFDQRRRFTKFCHRYPCRPCEEVVGGGNRIDAKHGRYHQYGNDAD